MNLLILKTMKFLLISCGIFWLFIIFIYTDFLFGIFIKDSVIKRIIHHEIYFPDCVMTFMYLVIIGLTPFIIKMLIKDYKEEINPPY